MKKILAFLVLLLFIPPLTAYAASVTSRSFVVRNWKAPLPSTPASAEEPVDEQAGEIETGDQAIPPESTTPPIFTGEVETGEQGEEQGEPTIPPDDVFTSTTPPSTPTSTTTPTSTEEVETVEQGEPEGEEQMEPSEQSEPEEPSEAAPEGEQGNFFGDDLNAHEVEMGEQSGEVETEEVEQGEPEEEPEAPE